MALRVGLVFLMLTLAVSLNHAFKTTAGGGGAAHFNVVSRHASAGNFSGNGRVGDCISEEEGGMMGTESSMRVLGHMRFISYDAMRKHNVTCQKRENSYYNCNNRTAANPNTRGCSAITRCARTYL